MKRENGSEDVTYYIAFVVKSSEGANISSWETEEMPDYICVDALDVFAGITGLNRRASIYKASKEVK